MRPRTHRHRPAVLFGDELLLEVAALLKLEDLLYGVAKADFFDGLRREEGLDDAPGHADQPRERKAVDPIGGLDVVEVPDPDLLFDETEVHVPTRDSGPVEHDDNLLVPPNFMSNLQSFFRDPVHGDHEIVELPFRRHQFTAIHVHNRVVGLVAAEDLADAGLAVAQDVRVGVFDREWLVG